MELIDAVIMPEVDEKIKMAMINLKRELVMAMEKVKIDR